MQFAKIFLNVGSRVTQSAPRAFSPLHHSQNIVYKRLPIYLSSLYVSTHSHTVTVKIPAADIDIDKLAAELFNEVDAKLKPNRLYASPQVSEDDKLKIITLLLASKISAQTILQILSTHPMLLTYPFPLWEEAIVLLKSYSFTPTRFLPLIVSSPSLLSGASCTMLKDVLMLLTSLGLSESKRHQIVVKNPKLLAASETKPMLKRYHNLLGVFTKTEAQSLLLSNPAILTDPWEETKRKIDFVYETMGIRSREILKSRVFERSLLHIMTRHQFAERAGFYRKPTKHEVEAVEAKRPAACEAGNKSLHELVDSDDESFARSIGGLTLDEYQTFATMMAAEYKEDLLSSETDDDSDVSDDDDKD